MHTISEIVKKYNTTRATMYYRFGQETISKYVSCITRDGNEVKAITDEGLAILVDELNLKPRENKDSHTESHIYDNTSSNTDNNSFHTDMLLEIIHQKDQEIQRLHGVIEDLNRNLGRALELNKNNQVLLLEKKTSSEEREAEDQNKSFWKRFFK